MTRLYYYGARYYDPRTSIWLGVDPQAEDYPNVSSYAYCANNPVKYIDPDGEAINLIAGGLGAGIGALIGGAIEAGTQIYKHGKVTDWKAVGGSVVQGAITGGAAGLTGGASLLVTATVAGSANAVGGTVNRAIQGKETTITDVAVDASVGAVLGAGGKVVGNAVKNATNNMSNAAKGKLGEAATKAKYGAKGYVSRGKADVATGRNTPVRNTPQVAKYDHDMKNIFTGKELTVESKFNTSGLTSNQRVAIPNVQTQGGLIIDRTTSSQLGGAAQTATTGAGAGVGTVTNRKK